jgi:hypothetical protein
MPVPDLSVEVLWHATGTLQNGMPCFARVLQSAI